MVRQLELERKGFQEADCPDSQGWQVRAGPEIWVETNPSGYSLFTLFLQDTPWGEIEERDSIKVGWWTIDFAGGRGDIAHQVLLGVSERIDNLAWKPCLRVSYGSGWAWKFLPKSFPLKCLLRSHSRLLGSGQGCLYHGKIIKRISYFLNF